MRVAGVWDWGAFLVRFGLGPELAGFRTDSYSGYDGNFGGFFLGGTGISFHASDWLAFTILASVVVDVHSGSSATTGYSGDNRENYFDYKSLEIEISGAATFYM